VTTVADPVACVEYVVVVEAESVLDRLDLELLVEVDVLELLLKLKVEVRV